MSIYQCLAATCSGNTHGSLVILLINLFSLWLYFDNQEWSMGFRYVWFWRATVVRLCTLSVLRMYFNSACIQNTVYYEELPKRKGVNSVCFIGNLFLRHLKVCFPHALHLNNEQTLLKTRSKFVEDFADLKCWFRKVMLNFYAPIFFYFLSSPCL